MQAARLRHRVFISGQLFELTGWRFLGVGISGSRFDPMGQPEKLEQGPEHAHNMKAPALTLIWQNTPCKNTTMP